MPSQLPEHAVVNLLRQCFKIPRCQAPQLRHYTLSRCPTRPFHKVKPVASHLESQQRCYHTQNKAADERDASRQNIPSELGLARRREFRLSVRAKQQIRGYSQVSQPPQRRFAVLGGGITGLSSAHYLTQELPNAKVTIYESGEKLGGWLKSKYVDVGSGRILFEQGPRTLRPNTPASLVTLKMVCLVHSFFNWC
jgi:protoporphyrinogen/coproporphyrinogen III oxidase